MRIGAVITIITENEILAVWYFYLGKLIVGWFGIRLIQWFSVDNYLAIFDFHSIAGQCNDSLDEVGVPFTR